MHSTETALIKVHNVIALAIDIGHSVILVLLDLSAAFDTVDHNILLSRLSSRFGICGTALTWFESYLSDRKQYVNINGSSSRSSKLSQGVPQGSVLGPILYSLYTSPLADIANAHDLNIHSYADDTQIYLTFNTSCTNDMISNKSKVEACIQDIKNWMTQNKLKMNNSKTDIIVISSSYRPRPLINALVVSNEPVECSATVKNIGVVFDKSLSFLSHITSTCKTAFFHLRNISKILNFLTVETTRTIIHAFVTLKLDYCISLFCDRPKYMLKRLQSVQNVLPDSFICQINIIM